MLIIIILKDKLKHYGFCDQALSLLSFYLHERKFVVQTDDFITSDVFSLDCGVPQGSVLGPLCFTLFINDFSNSLLHCKSLHYADDTAIFLATSNVNNSAPHLTSDLISANNWFSANKLTLNFEKSQFIIFSIKRLTQPPSLHINSLSLKPTDAVKYLGVTLDSVLNFNQHVSQICKKVYSILGMLRHTGYLLPLSARKLIYNTLIPPHFTYCIVILCSTSVNSLHKLDILLNKVCRAILLVKWNDLHIYELYDKLNWLNLNQLVAFNLLKLGHKLVHQSQRLTNIMPSLNTSGPNERSRRNVLNFNVPRYNTNSGCKSLTYRIVNVWNDLPLSLKEFNRPSLFKVSALTYLKQNSQL